jgi:hypothetical protein
MNRLALLYNPRWSPICALMGAKIIIYTRVHRAPAPAGPTLPAHVHPSKCLHKTHFCARNCSHWHPETGAFPACNAGRPWNRHSNQFLPCTPLYIEPQRQLGLALPAGVHARTRIHKTRFCAPSAVETLHFQPARPEAVERAFKPTVPCTPVYIVPQRQLGLALSAGVHACTYLPCVGCWLNCPQLHRPGENVAFPRPWEHKSGFYGCVYAHVHRPEGRAPAGAAARCTHVYMAM